MLSYVPEPEQRALRLVTRGRLQLVRVRIGLRNKIEALLEEMRLAWSAIYCASVGGRFWRQ